MHPAYSIIVFTTLTGIGYGLAASLGLGLLDPSSLAARAGYGLALLLIAAGLVSSLGHLGHPERAWRALSEWRSSWLSREGVAAVAAFLPIGAAALAAIAFGRTIPALGLVVALASAVTVFCTAMIYASLKTVAQWHTPLTPLAYLAFAAAGGLVAASAVAALTGEGSRLPIGLAVAALAVAWLVKALWWRRAAHSRSAATPESATGIAGLGPVRLLERPHVTENYLTKEMGYRIARKHSVRLRQLAVLFGALLPLAALSVGAVAPRSSPATVLPPLALGSHLLGMLVERWLFFAEARHTVMLYYGAETA